MLLTSVIDIIMIINFSFYMYRMIATLLTVSDWSNLPVIDDVPVGLSCGCPRP